MTLEDYRFVAVDEQFKLPEPVESVLTERFDARYRQQDGFTPQTKLMTWTTGGLDQVVASNTTSRSSCGARVPVRTLVPTTRWRVKMRNYSVTAGERSALTGKGITYGPMFGDGNFGTGVAVPLVTGDFEIPGDGSFYYSPWVTDPNAQLGPETDTLVAFGYTSPSNMTVAGLAIKWWFTNTWSQALDTEYKNQSIQNMYALPTDFQIEYEVSTTRLSGLWIGDSISEGIVGPANVSQSNNVLQQWELSYPNQWAKFNNAVINNVSGSGWSAKTFADNMGPWTRVDHNGAGYDFGVVALGTNDYMNATASAEFQSNMSTIVQRMRTMCGLEGKPIWFLSPTTRNQGNDSRRIELHNWLATKPLGAAGFVDLQTAIALSLTSTSWASGLSSDGVHPSYEGRDRLIYRVRRDMRFARPQSATVRNNDLFTRLTQAQYDAMAGGTDPDKLYLIRG
ncbi:hypothetical protein CH253_08040 [Rhodococcus sp. 06-156-3C]|uniref:SGNH/GDSL hydrolase family protein n=1 Tax=Rhodococcus sp. 06-156-3C TaxID=2022486 RepID=UPI000B9BE1D7|nr:SGNH/GDSL hydrolase family protein [Rhodococcus sp. 06-156-3C]OZD23803.1 hypothetical protein CH253_08040 [Rhodococcus sp. 06-156-3C]